jgi:1-deoxy-D-xylulose-5-phosphate synthase
MFNSGYEYSGPVAVRYPRGIGTGASYEKTEDTIEIGKSKTVLNSDNKEVVILFFGNLFDSAIQAGKEMSARVVDMRFIKPIDEELIQEISDDYKLIVTLEDNVVAGGAGSAVNEMLLKINTNSKILNIGLPDEFIEHGDQEQQKVINGLDGEGITKSIRKKLALV